MANIHCYFNWFLSSISFALNILIFISQPIESVMFKMVQWYDLYMYTPLQYHLSPYMARIPRCIRIGEKSLTIFNANIVTYSRTLLIMPIAWCLKYDYPIIACFLVIFHDFLDHVDGIVAKVQKRLYGETIDDPLLGGFLDAFCDKIVNIFCLWTILQETNFHQTSIVVSLAFVILCYTIIGLETAIGVVRVQDYFHAALTNKQTSQGSTAAAMEGKLKEKLESMGLAFLCLSTGYDLPFAHWSGIAGIVCFTLTIRLAYASLRKKLEAREKLSKKKSVRIDLTSETVPISPVQKTIGIVNAFNFPSEGKVRHRAMTCDSFDQQMKKKEERSSSTESSESDEDPARIFQRSSSLPSVWIDGRADKVYTIGCFDLFHEGHRLLLQRMRQFGRQVIVGVHDSRSIHKLKSRVPVDGTETRMMNVKRYADQVYCVAGTDPSTFVTCIVHLFENETAMYVRGDDMSDFPSRHVVEKLMPVKFLPYTNGVSSTKLRKELFSHIQFDDLEYLEKIN